MYLDDPEPHVLYSLVKAPELIRSERVDPKWFKNTAYQQLTEYLNENNGELDYIQIRDGFERAHPNVMTRDAWDYILEADVIVSGFTSWVSNLKQRYYHDKAIEAAKALAIEPSDDNYAKALIALQDAMANADSATEETLADLYEDMHDRIYNGKIEYGIKTFTPIDDYFSGGLMPGRLITIGARPAVGKSAFAINLILQALQKQHELTTDLFSLEMTNRETYQRMIAATTGIPSSKLVNPMLNLKDPEIKAVEEAGQKLNAYDFQPWDKQTSLQQIVKAIRQRAASAKNGYLAVVDYLGLITVPGQPDRRLQIEEITRQFKILTQELGIPIILLSQLSRGIENRMDKKPMLSDLRESGSIEQDSNAVMFLWNDDDSNAQTNRRTVTLTVAKNREGRIGDIRFNFESDRLLFRVAYV
ncbi:DnaB-like helicase C-terminal domain-containing protein [Lacticaseibacillus saniviri]